MSVLILAGVAPWTSARAEAEPRLDIELHAARSCADAAQFSARLRARLAPGALRDSLPIRFVLHITERTSGGVAATLALMRGASVTRRELQAGSCAEALDALALVAGLILDPTPPETTTKPVGPAANATPRPRPASAGGARETRAPGTSEEAPAPGETAASEAPAVPQSEAEDAGAESAQSATSESAEHRAARALAAADSQPSTPLSPKLRMETAYGEPGKIKPKFSLFIGPLLVTGVAPAVRPGASLGLLVGLQRQRLELALELDARAIAPHRTRSPEGRALFTFFGGAAKLCGFGLFSRGRLALSGCAVAELGLALARGSDTDAPSESRALWTALGPALRFEFRGTSRYWLRVGGELPFPVLRQRYKLGETTVFSVPHVTFRGELMLGVRFL